MKAHGFTLIEMIMAMVILGVISGMVAIFIARPIEGYVDSANRAELTDMADIALKRMALEIRTALPNSVRVGAGNDYVEFIPATGGGRYCSDTDACTNQLSHFGAGASATVSFDVLGPPPMVSNGDQIIIYNTGQTSLDAYANGSNCAAATVVDADTLQITDAPFPFASPSKRFFVAPSSGPVRFSCSGNQLLRVVSSPPVLPATTVFCGLTPTSSSSMLLQATSVSCNFQYSNVSAANGLLTLRLTLGNAGGTVTLMQQIHADNLP